MYESKEQILLYHGYALGCGGYVERDGAKLPIDAVAPAVISIVGGKCRTEHPEWQFELPKTAKYPKFFIRFSKCVTEVSSKEDDKQWTTTAESTVDGLNLCDVIRADRVKMKLTSIHLKKKKGQKKSEPHISFDGSEFAGLSVNGVSFDIPIDRDLDCFQTHSELKNVIRGKLRPAPRPGLPLPACKQWTENFNPRNLLTAGRKEPEYMRDLARKYVSDKLTRCSIVGDFEVPPETGAVKRGYSIDIDGFGRIFFGEMIVSDGMKRLNMIRFDLGCDGCAGGTVPAGAVNGDSVP
jgi:hypothetical protein